MPDSTFLDKIAEMLLFHTSRSGNEWISLEEYSGRIRECQENICNMAEEDVVDMDNFRKGR